MARQEEWSKKEKLRCDTESLLRRKEEEKDEKEEKDGDTSLFMKIFGRKRDKI